MDEQRWIPPYMSRLIGLVMVLMPLLLAGCGGPLPGHPEARTILPVSVTERVSVLPDGRRILFWPKSSPFGLMMLDIATGEEEQLSRDIGWARWLDDDLMYGEQFTLDPVDTYYAINLRPVAVVRLETLAAGAESLSERARGADSIYVVAVGPTGVEENLLLLLRLDGSARAVGGYAVYDVHDPGTVLAGLPYKTAPPERPFNSNREKYPSPDGKYYYTCRFRVGEGLVIYSQQGDLVNSVMPASDSLTLTCFGWAWDSSGVLFQEMGAGPLIGETRIGPLQLLLVEP